MEILFDGRIGVAYSQVYVSSESKLNSELDPSFVGQRNGLCGAAQRGFLWLTTGTQDGEVALRAERHVAEPPVDPTWQEIVEVSFTPLTADVRLQQWAAEAEWRLALPVMSYRVRYCASGMDEADDTESYALTFWPSSPAEDAIIKQTSAWAAYWHEEMRQRTAR